jgi:hypothetical protein
MYHEEKHSWYSPLSSKADTEASRVDVAGAGVVLNLLSCLT